MWLLCARNSPIFVPTTTIHLAVSQGVSTTRVHSGPPAVTVIFIFSASRLRPRRLRRRGDVTTCLASRAVPSAPVPRSLMRGLPVTRENEPVGAKLPILEGLNHIVDDTGHIRKQPDPAG